MHNVHCTYTDVKTIAAQLREAMEGKGWSVPDLLRKSRMRCDRSSLQRKLSGAQKLSTDEAQKLARVLGCTLLWDPSEARAS